MSEPKEFTRYLKKVTDEDITRLEELARENPTDLDILDWLAFALYSSGRYERAVQVYEQCISLEPDMASFHYFLGSSCYQMGAMDRAEAEWRRVMEMDHDGKFRSRASEKLKLLTR
ncbi:MAG: tetratricopeptide repeat protein [Candidatus Riflebacteria bacterium]|nr:tetratricopeptide repeat protein [Candidatus Riflebacteria bacterium]